MKRPAPRSIDIESSDEERDRKRPRVDNEVSAVVNDLSRFRLNDDIQTQHLTSNSESHAVDVESSGERDHIRSTLDTQFSTLMNSLSDLDLSDHIQTRTFTSNSESQIGEILQSEESIDQLQSSTANFKGQILEVLPFEELVIKYLSRMEPTALHRWYEGKKVVADNAGEEELPERDAGQESDEHEENDKNDEGMKSDETDEMEDVDPDGFFGQQEDESNKDRSHWERPDPQVECFEANYVTIIHNIATRHDIDLDSLLISRLMLAIVHHNDHVEVAQEAPQILLATNINHGSVHREWIVKIDIPDQDLLLLVLLKKAARAEIPDRLDRKAYRKLVEPVLQWNDCLQDLVTVLVGRLVLYGATLNPYLYQWTRADAYDVIIEHDLDWLVSAMDGNSEVFTSEEGIEMNEKAKGRVSMAMKEVVMEDETREEKIVEEETTEKESAERHRVFNPVF